MGETQRPRTIARNLASGLAHNFDIWGDSNAHVFLDGIKGGIIDDGLPFAVVSARGKSNAVRGDTTFSVEVLIGVHADADTGGNMALSDTDGGPVLEYGRGDEVERIAEATLNYCKQSNALGAVLRDAEVEYDFASLPVQFATLRLTFDATKTFGDL